MNLLLLLVKILEFIWRHLWHFITSIACLTLDVHLSQCGRCFSVSPNLQTNYCLELVIISFCTSARIDLQMLLSCIGVFYLRKNLLRLCPKPLKRDVFVRHVINTNHNTRPFHASNPQIYRLWCCSLSLNEITYSKDCL